MSCDDTLWPWRPLFQGFVQARGRQMPSHLGQRASSPPPVVLSSLVTFIPRSSKHPALHLKEGRLYATQISLSPPRRPQKKKKKNFSHLLRGRASFSILNHGWGRGEGLGWGGGGGVALLENEGVKERKSVCGRVGVGRARRSRRRGFERSELHFFL